MCVCLCMGGCVFVGMCMWVCLFLSPCLLSFTAPSCRCYSRSSSNVSCGHSVLFRSNLRPPAALTGGERLQESLHYDGNEHWKEGVLQRKGRVWWEKISSV